MTTPHTHTTFQHLLRSFSLGITVSLLSICAGILPDLLAQQPRQIFSTTAAAQARPRQVQRNPRLSSLPSNSQQQRSLAQARADEFSDAELRNYAAALMEIEPIRQSTLTQVIEANGGTTLPNLVCSDPKSMEPLNDEAKSLFVNFCNQSEKIATKKGLTNGQFNQITQAVRVNPQLQDRVRGFMD